MLAVSICCLGFTLLKMGLRQCPFWIRMEIVYVFGGGKRYLECLIQTVQTPNIVIVKCLLYI